MLAREIKKSKKSLENDGYFTAIDLSQSRVSVTDLVTSKNGARRPSLCAPPLTARRGHSQGQVRLRTRRLVRGRVVRGPPARRGRVREGREAL